MARDLLFLLVFPDSHSHLGKEWITMKIEDGSILDARTPHLPISH
jgi:hypothetical protein